MRYAAALLVLVALPLVGCSSSDPGFQLSCQEVRDPNAGTTVLGTFWRITNTADKPLAVSRVVFNGEHEALLAETAPYSVRAAGPDRTLPVTLTVGESADFMQWSFSEAPAAVAQNRAFLNALSGKLPGPVKDTGRVYRKEVIYADIETDRGKFRYRPSERRFERLP